MTRSPGLNLPRAPGPRFQTSTRGPAARVAHAYGISEYPVTRYTSREWLEREKASLWKKVWQFACREEDIPDPGDHYRYDIAGMSFLVVRTETGDLKCYPNACLHRGRMLKEFDGNAKELRCPFHGFCWKLDGQLQDIPADWDFPHIDQDTFSLPEIPLATWAGFIFINPDQGCAPLMTLSRI